MSFNAYNAYVANNIEYKLYYLSIIVPLYNISYKIIGKITHRKTLS